MPHRDTFAADNLLSRGQEIMVEVDESKAVELPLQPGEMSLHHVRLIHGSEPNPSAKRRIGFAIRYVPTYVRQAAGMRISATLVRGVDTYGHFEPERRPGFRHGARRAGPSCGGDGSDQSGTDARDPARQRDLRR